MPTIRFLPSNKSIEVSKGTVLIDAANSAGLVLAKPCGAKGACGKCVVRLIEGETESYQTSLLPKSALNQGFIQSCQAVVKEDITLEIPEFIIHKGQFTDVEKDISRIDPECFPKAWELESGISVVNLQIPDAQLGDGLSDFDRLSRQLKKNAISETVSSSLDVLRKLASEIRQDGGNLAVVVLNNNDQTKIIELSAGEEIPDQYAIAMDLGTTTVSAQLIDIKSNRIVETQSDYNQQIQCGVDVISRINYANRVDRLSELKTKSLETINQLIQRLIDQAQIKPDEIFSAVISGNTTMIHLLLGLNPEYIRLEPYSPTIHETPSLLGGELGIGTHPEAEVFISPAVGSYVGGDITSGILCTELSTDSEEISLLLDIGTNGELVIGNNDFLMTCACSAGPAFEGGGIKFGMRATDGAIEEVEIDPETGSSKIKTIGQKKPIGLCGTGLISLLASLFRTGWVDSAGKLNREKPCEYISLNGKIAEFTICSDDSDPKKITISEIEIEHLIRAKAAIYSACTLLLQQLELDFSSVSNFNIAGGFGRFLNLEDAITIGLLPDIEREKFKFLGNTSLIGSYFLAISQPFRKKQQELANRMTYIDLSSDPGYMDQYTAALFLPHTDKNLFPNLF